MAAGSRARRLVETGTRAADAHERTKHAVTSDQSGPAARQLEEAAADLVQARTGIEEKLGKVQELTGRISTIRADTAEARERQRQLELQRQKERDYRAQVRTETKSAEQVEAEGRKQAKLYRIERALNAAEQGLAECRTTEGKAAFQHLVDRYRLLAGLQAFLINSVARDGFGWGWIQGPTALDVLGADEQEVQVRGKAVAWADVSPRQYLHFIKHFVNSENVRLSAQVDHAIAAAIWCEETGQVAQIPVFLKEALQKKATARARIERLLPEQTSF